MHPSPHSDPNPSLALIEPNYASLIAAYLFCRVDECQLADAVHETIKLAKLRLTRNEGPNRSSPRSWVVKTACKAVGGSSSFRIVPEAAQFIAQYHFRTLGFDAPDEAAARKLCRLTPTYQHIFVLHWVLELNDREIFMVTGIHQTVITKVLSWLSEMRKN